MKNFSIAAFRSRFAVRIRNELFLMLETYLPKAFLCFHQHISSAVSSFLGIHFADPLCSVLDMAANSMQNSARIIFYDFVKQISLFHGAMLVFVSIFFSLLSSKYIITIFFNIRKRNGWGKHVEHSLFIRVEPRSTTFMPSFHSHPDLNENFYSKSEETQKHRIHFTQREAKMLKIFQVILKMRKRAKM